MKELYMQKVLKNHLLEDSLKNYPLLENLTNEGNVLLDTLINLTLNSLHGEKIGKAIDYKDFYKTES